MPPKPPTVNAFIALFVVQDRATAGYLSRIDALNEQLTPCQLYDCEQVIDPESVRLPLGD